MFYNVYTQPKLSTKKQQRKDNPQKIVRICINSSLNIPCVLLQEIWRLWVSIGNLSLVNISVQMGKCISRKIRKMKGTKRNRKEELGTSCRRNTGCMWICTNMEEKKDHQCICISKLSIPKRLKKKGRCKNTKITLTGVAKNKYWKDLTPCLDIYIFIASTV